MFREARPVEIACPGIGSIGSVREPHRARGEHARDGKRRGLGRPLRAFVGCDELGSARDASRRVGARFAESLLSGKDLSRKIWASRLTRPVISEPGVEDDAHGVWRSARRIRAYLQGIPLRDHVEELRLALESPPRHAVPTGRHLRAFRTVERGLAECDDAGPPPPLARRDLHQPTHQRVLAVVVRARSHDRTLETRPRRASRMP